jgi:hypothetical protein
VAREEHSANSAFVRDVVVANRATDIPQRRDDRSLRELVRKLLVGTLLERAREES